MNRFRSMVACSLGFACGCLIMIHYKLHMILHVLQAMQAMQQTGVIP